MAIDGDWFEDVRRQIFGSSTPCTVSLHQARVLWREIAALRKEVESYQSEVVAVDAVKADLTGEIERLRAESQGRLELLQHSEESRAYHFQQAIRMRAALERSHLNLRNAIEVGRITCRCRGVDECEPHAWLLDMEQALDRPVE